MMKLHVVAGWASAAMVLFAVSTTAVAGERELLREAKVNRMHAERIALAATHGGTIKSGELEREKGRLVWSFDVTKPNTSGVTEVLLDAKTAKVISVKRESPAQEKAEARAERHEKK